MPLCPACGRKNPDDSRFCGSCGAPLAEVAPPRDVRKTVTVVFCDVTGSTALGEQLDPESLRRVMARYFDEMQAVVERHEGIVEKFIGDAVMAVFGVPVLHEDDALRAVRAAAEMRERLDALNEELEGDWGTRIQVRTGVNTGEVVAGDAGGGGQRFATGDAVNVAKRFEEAAPAGEILLGEPTYRLVRDAVEVEPAEALELKGKEGRVPAYRLLAIEAGAEGRARRLDSPMVGRERERTLLRQAYERARDDRGCQLFTVLGAAGVGKSRLVAEFLSELGPEATVVRGRCLSYGEGITFWPILEMVRELHGEQFQASISAQLGDDKDAELIAERIAAAVGVAETAAVGEETLWAIRKLFEAQARERPFVAVLDDVQWGQRTFHDLIEHIADWSRDAPILLVCLARPELLDERPGWSGGKFNATSVLLEPLNDEEAGQLVDNFLGQAQLDAVVGQRVTEAAEGNPLFVEEMLAMLIDDGLLERRNGGWAATGDLGDVAVPPTIQALLGARLDRLAPDERSVIERASIEGKVFHRGSVVELAPPDLGPQVMQHLQALVRRELVRPDKAELAGEDAFRFRHLLIRDAAYEGMPKALRADLHERFTDWLERMISGREAEYEELLGYHLEQAYRYRTELAPEDEAARDVAERAASRLAAAGQRALLRGDKPAGSNLLSRAVELLPKVDVRRAELLRELGSRGALIELGELERAEEVLVEAIETARACGDRILELRATLEHHLLRNLVDETAFEALKEAAAQGIVELEELGDDAALAHGWSMIAQVHLMESQGAAMAEASERALEYARRAGDRTLEVESLMWLLRNAWFGPRPVDEGIQLCTEVLEQTTGESYLESVAIEVLGVLHAMRGEFETARELVDRARAIQLELGLRLAYAAGTAMMGGAVELLAGDPAAAEKRMRNGYEILVSIGEKAYLSTLVGNIAEAIYRQGRFDEAEQTAREARELSAPEDVESQRLWRGVIAKVLARRGQFEEAKRLAREALELADRSDGYVGADTRLDLVEVLMIAGQDGIADILDEAIAVYEAKGVTVGVARARALAAGELRPPL
jgi:predicted ATPase/class 3 adenylate cyclase